MLVSKRKVTSKFISRTLLTLIIIVSTYLNMNFVRQYGGQLGCFNLQIDSEIYHNLASAIVTEKALDIPITHPPGYVVFLAALYTVFGINFLAPKIAFVVCISISILLTYRLGRRIFGCPEALVGAGLVAFSPLLSAYAATLQYEIFVMFILLFTVTAGLAAVTTEHRVWRPGAWMLFGFLLALTVLSRETLILLVPIALAATLAQQRPISARVFDAACLSVPLILGVGGWIVFQYWNTGLLVPISNKGPVNFHIGNNPNATGTFNLVASSIGEPKGLEFIQQEPGWFLELSFRKFLYFFGFLRDGWGVPEPLAWHISRASAHLFPLNSALAVVRSALPLLAFLSMLVMRSRIEGKQRLARRGRTALFLIILAALLPHLVFISSVRFLIPVYPFMALLAATSIVFLLEFRSIRSTLTLIVASAGAVSIFVEPRALGTLSVSPESLEGTSIGLEISDGVEAAKLSPNTSNAPAAFVNEEYIGKGPFNLTFRARSTTPGSGRIAFLLNDRTRACESDFATDAAVQSFSFPCFISGNGVVKPLIFIKGPESVFMSDVSIGFGGDGLDLQPGKLLFGEGWGEMEIAPDSREFRWSIGSQSSFLFSGSGKRSAKMRFDANPFGGGGVSADVYLNDAFLQKVLFGPAPWQGVEIPLPPTALVSGLNRLRLRFSRSKRPCDLGPTADCRELAVAVSNAGIVE